MGVINIYGNLEKKQLQLLISDNGPGIHSNIQEKVFDAFFQGPAPDKSQIKGSGLGLTIVKELLMRLNGKISIQSQDSNNKGTQFQITLPSASKVRE